MEPHFFNSGMIEIKENLTLVHILGGRIFVGYWQVIIIKGHCWVLNFPKVSKEERKIHQDRELHKECMVKNRRFSLMHHLDLVALHLHLLILKEP